MKRCYGCFECISTPEEYCPACGFMIRSYKAPQWVLTPGTLLNNKYQIGRTLGIGGFGITYLAWDINMETRVAIKEYYPGYLVSRDVTSASGNRIQTTLSDGERDFRQGLKKYVKEAATLAQFFELPGIVSVKDFFYENETAYIVMEYIDGVSLKKFLEQKGGKVSAEEALKLIEPVIKSLAVIHKNKLLHRDISPDNIMLDKNGKIKLIDFGAARYFEQETDQSMTVVLKHGYAPIEQYSRNGEQGAAIDVYSVCAVLYRMITGRMPMEATQRVQKDDLIPVLTLEPKVPKYIAEAIEKGLSVYVTDRYRSMEELHRELYSSWQSRLSKGLSRFSDHMYRLVKKILIIVIVCLLLVVGAGIIYRLNSDKIDYYSSKVREVFEEETTKPVETSDKEKEDEEAMEEESEAEMQVSIEEKEDTETGTKIISTKEKDVQTENTSQMENTVQQNISSSMDKESGDVLAQKDPRVEHGIVVARDGYLNGRAEMLTVGEILDRYSESVGSWDGYVGENDQIYIYYQGSKNGSIFVIEFQVYSGDTFKITGAAQNGETMENYSEFFQQILEEIGV